MPTDRLIVLNKDEDTISVLDVETGETTEKIDTEFNPHEVAVGPSGDLVYVTCSQGGALLQYDAENWERISTVEHEHFAFPHGLAVRPSADELWLAATYSSRLFAFDLETLDLLDVFPTHQDKSHMIAIDGRDEYGYVANIGSDSVTVVDLDERRIVADPLVGEGPEGIAVHSDAGVFVANQDDGLLTVLDPDTYEETSKAVLGKTPVRVVISPDGETALIPNRESNDVSVVACAYDYGGETRPWEIARIPVGIWPGGTTFSPDGRRAYVANNKTNDVSVIDIERRTEIERFDTGVHPDGIAYLER